MATLDFSTLTERQREIYEFIRERIEARGYGPTVREIGLGFDIKSPNGVMCHLKALETKGFIEREANHARAIRLTNHRPPSVGLPLLGNVAAGAPLATEQMDGERLEFSDLFGEPGLFALKVKGRSMIEDNIADGDFVVIRRQETAENGQRVVAMVNNDMTLKKFVRKKDQIRLEPMNETMDPITIDPDRDDVQVLGLLVGVVRRC